MIRSYNYINKSYCNRNDLEFVIISKFRVNRSQRLLSSQPNRDLVDAGDIAVVI
jgi:hypothetical protein